MNEESAFQRPGRPTIEQDTQNFLELLKRLGGSSGNYALKNKLGWENDRYWRTHAELLDKGSIVRGRGQGGSVIIAEEPASVEEIAQTASPNQSLPTITTREADLYPPARKVIEESWTREKSYDESIVEVTAVPPRMQTGGTWTRPDISVLATKSYPFLPGRYFEIVTFELKRSDTIDVRGVFEALSHSQFATLSYVVFFLEGKDFKEHPNSERILDTAARHGIGVFVASDITKYEFWDELIDPRRNIPDPEQANQFIATSFTEETKNKVIKWHK